MAYNCAKKEKMMLYGKIIKALNESKLKYFLAGGVAAAFYQRKDNYFGQLDLVICIRSSDLNQLLEVIKFKQGVDEHVDILMLTSKRFDQFLKRTLKVGAVNQLTRIAGLTDLKNLTWKKEFDTRVLHNRLEYWLKNTNCTQRLKWLDKSFSFIRSFT